MTKLSHVAIAQMIVDLLPEAWRIAIPEMQNVVHNWSGMAKDTMLERLKSSQRLAERLETTPFVAESRDGVVFTKFVHDYEIREHHQFGIYGRYAGEREISGILVPRQHFAAAVALLPDEEREEVERHYNEKFVVAE